MQHNPGIPQRRAKPYFYLGAVGLLIGAVTIALLQKHAEKTATIAAASGGNVQKHIGDAGGWALVSLVTVAAGIVAWGIAARRGETPRRGWMPMIILLSLYALLELLMV